MAFLHQIRTPAHQQTIDVPTGFLNKISGELPLENVESIYIAEPLFGRILGYGTVAVTSVGAQVSLCASLCKNFFILFETF